jgi:hypothetical protein
METKFRADVNALMADENGIVFEDSINHNTEIVLSGVTYSRFIEIINGYTVTFEDLQYGVNTTGANHNLADVVNRNQVSVLTQNSAGLIRPIIDASEASTVATAVWREPVASHSGVAGSFAQFIAKKLLTVSKFLGLK